MKDLRKVAKPSKDNWKLWVNIGNDLIDEYEEILGLSEPEIDDTGYRDKIRDSITSVKDMFALLEAESAFKKRQKRKDLDDRWNYWKKVIMQAYKTVPGPAKDAFKNIIRRRDKIYFAATDSSDPALGGSSGFDPGTKSSGTFTGSGDDVEADAIDTQQNTIKFQGKRVPKLNKDNWKQWIVRAQRLLAKYSYTYGSRKKTESINEELRYFMQLVEKPKDNIDWSKIEPMSGDDERDWNQIKNMFSAMGATLPDEATKAWEDLEFQKSKGDVDVKAKQRAYGDTDDPALGGSSGFDPGTKSTGTFTGNADDIEQDAMLANLPKQSGMGMQSQIDPSNRVSKDQQDRDGHLERIKNIVYVLDKNNLKKAISKGRAEVEEFLLTDRLPTKEIRKYTTKYYALVAQKFDLQGLLFKGNIYFADGSSTKADPNDETHKEIAQAQYELGALDNRDADQYVDMYGLKDLPSQSGMAQQMQAGSKGFKRDEVEWNGKPVPALNKYNWKQWIELGNGLLTRYLAFKDKSGNESVQYKNTLTIAESIRSYLNTLTEKTEMSDQDKANWKLLQQQFAKVKKELPSEALKAYRDLELKKRDYDISGIDSGPFDDNRDFGKDRYDAKQKETYGDFYDIIQSVLKNTNLQTIKAAEQKIEKMNKEFRNLPVLHSTMKAQMYGSIAKRLGWKGIFNLDGKTVTFADTTPRKPNFFGDLSDMDKRLFMNGEHVTKDVTAVEKDADMKKIAYKQFRLGFLPNAVIPKFINKLNSADPNSEEKTATGGALPKLTLKGKMHLNKELPPLSSATVEDYKKVYRKILRRYTAGTGKGRSYSKVPESISADSIRQILNILSEAGEKMSSADMYANIEDLTAIEQAFKDAEKRKLITPQEVADFAPLISRKEQLINQLKYDPKEQGDKPDNLKKAMAIKAPGSDTNYGVFNDQIKAVLSNPTADNLVTQANKVLGEVGFFDTRWNAMNNFYGIIAQELGLEGLISHVDTAVNPPQVFYSRAKQTELSKKLGDKMPRGEFESENLDFSDPKHRKIAQAQLDKNLLPASITYQQQKVNPQEEFNITKQEPQEPEKTDVSRTVKSGERGKPSEPTDLDAADALQAAGQAAAGGEDPEIDAANQPEPDAMQRPDFTGTRKELPPTDKLHYERFIPLPTEINSLLRLSKKRQYYVDRVRDSESNAGANLSDTLNIVNQDTANGGSYKIARQISKDMSQAAYKAIIDMLKSRNLEFIDQAQAKKFADFKATNAQLDKYAGDPLASRKLAYYMGPDKEGSYTVYDARGTKISVTKEKPNLPDKETYDRSMLPDPEKGGDLWSQSQFGKDALAKKKADRDRKYNYDADPDRTGSGVGSPGTGTGYRPASDLGTGKPPGKAVYYEYIKSSGQMKKRVWVERDANGTVVNRGKEDQEYTGPLPTKNEYLNRQQATTASHSQGGGQGGNNLRAGQGVGHSYGQPGYQGKVSTSGHSYGQPGYQGKVSTSDQDTGSDTGGQAADSEAIQKIVNSLTNTLRQMQSKPIDKEVFYDKWAELFGQEYEKYANNPNTLTQTQQQLMNQAMKLKGQIEELRLKQQAVQSGVGGDSSHPDTAGQRPQVTIPGLDAARKELDNQSTDFTRLLKNAGLLKEFY